MFDFCPRAKFVCRDHLLHFVVHTLLRVAKLCFFIFFLVAQPLGHRSRPNQVVDKGRGRLNLCGLSGHMWIRMGKNMNGAKRSGREVM